jgi:signal transduction histidine kinase
MWWKIGAASNAAIAVAYLAIGWAILRPLIRTGQLRQNLLGAATAAVFLTGALHHGLQGLSLLPSSGSGRALRSSWDWRWVAVDLAAVAAAGWYWTLRRVHGSLVHGAKLFEDVKEKQRQALEINDTIVQGLTVAHIALELDQKEDAREALERTLVAARSIITELLGDVDGADGGFPLRRREPATVRETGA